MFAEPLFFSFCAVEQAKNLIDCIQRYLDRKGIFLLIGFCFFVCSVKKEEEKISILIFFREIEMLVANSFDLWQKDTFFSAAEEVQRSADM